MNITNLKTPKELQQIFCNVQSDPFTIDGDEVAKNECLFLSPLRKQVQDLAFQEHKLGCMGETIHYKPYTASTTEMN